MSNYSAPGVYVREEDKSLYTKGQSTSTGGFIGIADFGPVGEPVLITSLASFEEKFGNARLDSYLYHGVKDFFEQGGSICYVVRTAHYTDVTNPSTLTAIRPLARALDAGTPAVGTTPAVPPAPAVDFRMPHGAYYNGYYVELISVAANTFDVVLRDAANNQVEYHRSILFGLDNVGSDRHVEAYFPRMSFHGLTADDLMLNPPVAGSYAFSGGNDGLTGLSDSDFIGSSSAKTGLYAFNSIPTVRLIAAPGNTSPAFIQALITYCENRQNIVPIFATPSNLTPQQAINFRRGIGAYTHSAFNSSHAALYWPWVKELDPATRRILPIPPEGGVMGIYARTDAVAWPWIAAAGKERGIWRNALGVEYSADDAENGEIYDNQINVIRNFPESGVVVWGQKTLTDAPTAFDRMNVRRLFLYAEQALKEASDRLVFRPNNPATWSEFVRLARPLLADIQDKGGIYSEDGEPGYRIVCDETTNTPLYRERNTMRALVYIRPTKAAEFIELSFIALGADVTAGFENLNQF